MASNHPTNKNSIMCTQCGTVLTSNHRHDFVSCECPNSTYVDGGLDYLKCGGKSLAKIAVWDKYTKTFVPLNL
jgi:hypothetical protein